MSFYHVLPSNVAPNTFPNNHASEFSIPLDNPYNLAGQWEVAMMNISYTGCVNTFYHDKLTLTLNTDFKTRILKTQSPVRWDVPQQKTVGDMLINFVKLKDIFDVSIEEDTCHWKLKVDHLFIVISHSLAAIMRLDQNVLMPHDSVRSFKFNASDPMPKNVSFTFVPTSYTHHSIEIKAENEEMSITQVMEKFNQTVPNASMTKTDRGIQIIVNEGVIVLSHPFAHFVGYEQRGVSEKVSIGMYLPDLHMNMKKPWSVDVYQWDKVEKHSDPIQQEVSLQPISFQRHSDAVAYLNEHVPQVKFSMDERKYITLTIAKPNVRIRLSDTLRDILALDKNEYVGPGSFKATGILSLTRRIRFLYVYSNITDYVRIGNMEAPLLAVIPFSVSSSCDILKEESYKNPMYIPVCRSTMSQIDIAIHDDAGALVPFVTEAVTSLRLHYRQI